MSLILWMLVACGRYEGDDPYECADGADNDRDGAFDCQDEGCWGSPDCQADADTDADSDSDTDADADADADADSDTDTDTDTTDPDCVACDLTEVDIEYRLNIIPVIPAAEFGLVACQVDMVGSGTFVEGETNRATFEGTWTVVAETCSATAYEWPGIWYDEVAGAAYHSLEFDSSGTVLVNWFAHKNIGAHDASTTNNRFYITEMAIPVDPTLSEELLEHSEFANPDGFTDFENYLRVTIRR